MTKDQYRIEGLTIAVNNMEGMVAFYTAVFGIEFEEKSMYGAILNSGQWGDFKLLLCPAELAGIVVDRNRQQFDIVVDNLEEVLKLALDSKGRMLGDVQSTPEFKTVSVFDPDGNSIVFKELL